MSATKAVPPSKTEGLAAEAAPAVKPVGSPALVPFLSLPRRVRADVLRALTQLTDRQEALDVESEDVSLDRGAELYELLADMEDMLRLVAADNDVFDAWAGGAADEDLGGLLGWYMDRFQVGEAKASQS